MVNKPYMAWKVLGFSYLMKCTRLGQLTPSRVPTTCMLTPCMYPALSHDMHAHTCPQAC
jgi:hypothetical protein